MEGESSDFREDSLFVIRQSDYESINAEIDRVAREGRLNTTWYDALSSEYGRAYEQYKALEKQYDERFPDKNRVGGVLVGTGIKTAGEFLSAGGTMMEFNNKYGMYLNPVLIFNPTARMIHKGMMPITEYVADWMCETGDDLSGKGQAKIDEQKEGLNEFGQFAVDLGSSAAQLALDIGLGIVTGGGSAAITAIRTFGGAATEARADGAELEEQMLYAATSAALSYGIEGLCNVAFAEFKRIAPGITDQFVTDAVENLAQKLASTPEGAEALLTAGMLIASGAGEGVEETLESLLQPFLQQLSYDTDAKNVFQDPGLLADAAYDGFIASLLGVFARGTNTEVDLVDNLVHNEIMPGEKLMAEAGVSESEVLGAMAVHQMGKMDDTTGVQDIGSNSDSGVTYSPVNPGPLEEDVANSFNGATYTMRVLTEDAVMYRVSGGSAKVVGSYMTRTPQQGGLQSRLDLALLPKWGNTAEHVRQVMVPKGTVIYEGTAAPQNICDSRGNVIGTLPGGGNQIYIPRVEERWFQ